MQAAGAIEAMLSDFRAYSLGCFTRALSGSLQRATALYPVIGIGAVAAAANAMGFEVIFEPGTLGSILAFIVYTLAAWIVIFVFRLIFVAPYQLWAEERANVSDLQSRFQDKQKRELIVAALENGRVKMHKLLSLKVSSEADLQRWMKHYKETLGEVLRELSAVLPALQVEILLTPNPKNLPSMKRKGFQGKIHICTLCVMDIIDRLGDEIRRHAL